MTQWNFGAFGAQVWSTNETERRRGFRWERFHNFVDFSKFRQNEESGKVKKWYKKNISNCFCQKKLIGEEILKSAVFFLFVENSSKQCQRRQLDRFRSRPKRRFGRSMTRGLGFDDLGEKWLRPPSSEQSMVSNFKPLLGYFGALWAITDRFGLVVQRWGLVGLSIFSIIPQSLLAIVAQAYHSRTGVRKNIISPIIFFKTSFVNFDGLHFAPITA